MTRLAALTTAILLALSTASHAASPQPNAHSFIDADKEGIAYNGHVYDYDILSGATVQPSRPFSGKAVKPMPLEEKDKIMYLNFHAEITLTPAAPSSAA